MAKQIVIDKIREYGDQKRLLENKMIELSNDISWCSH